MLFLSGSDGSVHVARLEKVPANKILLAADVEEEAQTKAAAAAAAAAVAAAAAEGTRGKARRKGGKKPAKPQINYHSLEGTPAQDSDDDKYKTSSEEEEEERVVEPPRNWSRAWVFVTKLVGAGGLDRYYLNCCFSASVVE
jgi:hypothetical protein